MKGRKPTPAGIRKLRGNPDKRKHAPEAQPGGLAVCPEHLDDVARAEWVRASRELLACGLLTSVDMAVFAAYCAAYSEWVRSSLELAASTITIINRQGNVVRNPLVGIVNTARSDMVKFAAEFGMSASSRSRVAATGGGQDDALEVFLGKIA